MCVGCAGGGQLEHTLASSLQEHLLQKRMGQEIASWLAEKVLGAVTQGSLLPARSAGLFHFLKQKIKSASMEEGIYFSVSTDAR